MELSPEERRKVFEEEKARLEIQARAKKQAGDKMFQLGCLAPMGVLVLFFVVLFAYDSAKPKYTPIYVSPPPARSSTFSGFSPTPAGNQTAGSDTKLVAPGLDNVPVAVDEKAYEAMMNAAAVKDDQGITNLILAGRVFTVSNSTKVQVISPGFLKAQVRILEGPKAGRSGWVPTELTR